MGASTDESFVLRGVTFETLFEEKRVGIRNGVRHINTDRSVDECIGDGASLVRRNHLLLMSAFLFRRTPPGFDSLDAV
jgi:hypothetical protein